MQINKSFFQSQRNFTIIKIKAFLLTSITYSLLTFSPFPEIVKSRQFFHGVNRFAWPFPLCLFPSPSYSVCSSFVLRLRPSSSVFLPPPMRQPVASYVLPLSLSVLCALSFLDARTGNGADEAKSLLPIHAVHVSRVNGTCTVRRVPSFLVAFPVRPRRVVTWLRGLRVRLIMEHFIPHH